ncbi:hypothetical protein GCM10010358_83580 [Streptomyces minutiscleroticus]|uniref:Uncharacterized protein n=1 Tax=Streptomyces minutiscleroticus TaxID=68238 RepID=A0A918UBA6_9ACTN|nr:hypothetical protein GCM10010358_83580 [Streptomyces minutiscleroticus]
MGLVTALDGRPLTVSSRALAAGRAMRIRINLMPVASYDGPHNVFDALESVREAAAESAVAAWKRELELDAQKRAEQASGKEGQISDSQGAGRIFDPSGQNFDPLGQISAPCSGGDLQDPEPLLSPSAPRVIGLRGRTRAGIAAGGR